MARGKRSDPKKLERERKQIEKDMARRETPKAPNPVKEAAKALVEAVKRRGQRERAKRAGFGAPPQIEGALVTGFKKPRGDA